MGEGSVTQSRYFALLATMQAWREIALILHEKSTMSADYPESEKINSMIDRAERLQHEL